MQNLKEYIKESFPRFRGINDVKKFLNKFKDNERKWSGATDEIADMANWAMEFLDEFDNINIDPVDREVLKTPSDWNTNYKQYILDIIGKMSKEALKQYLAHLNNRF